MLNKNVPYILLVLLSTLSMLSGCLSSERLSPYVDLEKIDREINIGT
jgi:hypothetical protein